MTRRNIYIISFLILILSQSCGSSQYIYDEESKIRQTELKKNRSGNVFADIGISLASIIFSSTLDVGVALFPKDQEFTKFKILNASEDTLFVNMLTDVYWDEFDYCDFMDIRIPPDKKCKLLVPVDAAYNVYFSNTLQSDDDELIEIYTGNLNKISLYPGLTEVDKMTSISP